MGDRNVGKVKAKGKVLYRVKRKGYKRGAEEPKQRIKGKASTPKRYKNRVKQYRQNRLFQSNRSKFYQDMDGKSYEENIISDNRGRLKEGCGGWRVPPIFCNHLFFAITLKNYKLCYLKLN